MMTRKLSMLKRRGYTLVEMGLTLAVLGILIGGALVPVSRQYEKRQINEVRELLAEARGAVVSYALANRNNARRVLYYNDTIYDMPGGRPYLPCPDITGDGVEDRSAISPGIPITASVSFNAEGVCASLKGALPWKTLGMSDEVDPWGNRLTYHVAHAYSNAMIGFDETYRADRHVWHGYLHDIFGGTYQFFSGGGRYDNILVWECAQPHITGGCDEGNADNVIVGGVVFDNPPPIAGIPYPGYAAGADPRARIVDSPAFLVMSHGRNGWYAINISGDCNSGPANITNLDLMNASYIAAPPTMPNCPRSANYWADYHTGPIVFGSSDPNVADDIVDWMMGDEMFGYLMENGQLPIVKLPFVPDATGR